MKTKFRLGELRNTLNDELVTFDGYLPLNVPIMLVQRKEGILALKRLRSNKDTIVRENPAQGRLL